MSTPRFALAAMTAVCLGSLGFTTSAQAAPVILQFAVHIDRLCDQSANCHDASSDDTMTYVFDDTIIGGYAYDLSTISIHRSDFASASMTMSGPLAGIDNPFSTATIDSSAWLYSYEGRQPEGSLLAQFSSNFNQQYEDLTTFGDGSTHQVRWQQQFQMLGQRRSDTAGDGFASTTAADFVNELGLGSFFFSWNVYLRTQDCAPGGFCNAVVTDPRSFLATGSATLIPPPAVPEPTSVLLLATGLAGFFARSRKS